MSSFVILSFMSLITSWISGVLGLGGGLIMLFVLFQFLPAEEALILQATIALFCCGYRSVLLFSKINWSITRNYIIGMMIPFVALLFVDVQFSKKMILLLIGGVSLTMPFLKSSPIDIRHRYSAQFFGGLIGLLSFGVGAAGPLYNVFFLNKDLEKDEVMATKAITSTAGLSLKLVFLYHLTGSITEETLWLVPALLFHSALGTKWAESSRARLSEKQFLLLGKWIVGLIGLSIIWETL